VIGNTSLDEGDVVRVLRRTIDLLAQIPYCEAVSQQLRDNARAALRAINRFPVCELEDLLPKPPAAIERPKPEVPAEPQPESQPELAMPGDFASPHSDLEG
jgi:hypothetical protein